MAEQRRRQQRVVVGVVATVTVAMVVLLVVIWPEDAPTPEPALTVSMVEMAFEPDPIELDADDAVLRIVNDGALPHSLVVPELGKGTPDLGPGEELTVDLAGTEPGAYYVYCDIAGHLEEGMETTLVVR